MKLSNHNQQQKCTENLLFVVVQSVWTLRINQSTFSIPCLKMQGRAETKNDFVSEFQMFFPAKLTKEIFPNVAIKCTFRSKKGPGPPNNQPKSFSGRRQKECITRKRKRMLCSELKMMTMLI